MINFAFGEDAYFRMIFFKSKSKTKAARVMGLIAGNAEVLDETVNISESVAILTEVIRENVKNGKLKQGVLPALGELLYFIAQQVNTTLKYASWKKG